MNFTTLKLLPQLPKILIFRNIRIKRWPTLDNPWIERELENPPAFKKTDSVNYIVSKDHFKFVQKILPSDVVPPFPTHTSYPTPSGWVPPDTKKNRGLPYFVRRTRNYNLPVYFVEKERVKAEKQYGIRQITVIKKIDGDIGKLEEDLRIILQPKIKTPLLTQIDEATRRILIEGIFQKEVSDFLLERGF